MALPIDRQRFLDWLTTPPEAREPRTRTELAKELGVTVPTLKRWEGDPEFLRLWEEQYYKTIGNPGRKAEIMDTLLRTATDQDDPKHVQAAKTYFEIEGSMKPTQVSVEMSRKSLDTLSDEDLAALAAKVAGDELAARREAS